MPTNNPFPLAVLSLLDMRVHVDALSRSLTRVDAMLQRANIGMSEQPMPRAEFARTLRADLSSLSRDLHSLAASTDEALNVMQTLVARIEAGEDLARYDVTPPWEVRR